MRLDLSSSDLWRSFRGDWWGILKRTWASSNDDNLGMIAAGAAFYIIASIAPILAALVLSYGLFAESPRRNPSTTSRSPPTPQVAARGWQR